MKRKVVSILLIIISIICLTGCGSKKEEKAEIDDKSALKTIRKALNEVYENNEKITTNNVQKHMVGNWVIVQAPADNTRNKIPKELDQSTADEEWTTMFITACNSNTKECKDLRIMKSSDDGKLFVGSESGAFGKQ